MNTPSLLKHSAIATIAEAHKKSSAQVLLRWATQRGIHIVPKSKSISAHRPKKNCES